MESVMGTIAPAAHGTNIPAVRVRAKVMADVMARGLTDMEH